MDWARLSSRSVEVEDGQEVGLILAVEWDIAVIADAFNGCAIKFRNESVIKSGGERSSNVLIKEDLRFFLQILHV